MARTAFTLVEVMIAIVLMAVIILGLMAMFSQTQRAFKAGMTQTDILEGGRMATEMLSRELEQIVPSYSRAITIPGQTNFNFYTLAWNEFRQSLPASTSVRTNVLEDLFFVVHQNQTWTGIGYFVVADSAGVAGTPKLAGTLFRFEKQMSAAQFANNPAGLYTGFALARSYVTNVSKILNGVISFNFHAYDTNGYWINPFMFGQVQSNAYWTTFYPADQVNVDYRFISNAVPAYVEFELGVLEQSALDHYKSIPLYLAQSNYLAQQAGRVQVFRQRVSVRNVDRAAY